VKHDAAIRLIDFPATPVATLEHRGDKARIDDSVRRFIAWRRQAGLAPATHATFNIIRPGAPGENFDICVATDAPVPANGDGIVAKIISGGRCAVLRHVGAEDALPDAIAWLYGEWLPHSGERLRDAPLFFQRVQFPPFVAADQAITDIFLPLRDDADVN